MDLPIDGPTVSDSAQLIRDLLDADELAARLREHVGDRPGRKKGIERLLRQPLIHPVIVYLSRTEQWLQQLREAQAPVEGDLFRFVWVAHVLRSIRSLSGADAFLEDLARNIVARPTRATIRAFWDTLFEAEVATSWAASGYEMGFGPVSGNPDVYFERPSSSGEPLRFPIECWRCAKRYQYTERFEEIWTQLQTKLIRLMREQRLLLKVSIRAHRQPQTSDISPLLHEVARLAEMAAKPSNWVTSDALEQAYQVSVGVVGPLGMRLHSEEIDNEYFDISAEPVLSLPIKATREPDGKHTWIDPCVLALRVDLNPNWMLDHVRESLSSKSQQIHERAKPLATDPETGREVACGAVAIQLPRLSDGDLLAIDAMIREQLSTRHGHVSFVCLYCMEDFEAREVLDASADTTEVKRGIRMVPYVIANPSPLLPTPGLQDSRSARFGSDPQRYHVVDQSTGQIAESIRAGSERDDLEEKMDGAWPPSLATDISQQLTPIEDGLGFVINDPEPLWKISGDLLLGQIPFGENVLRVVRDEYLNLRALRLGAGKIREHVALDIRPFRGARKLLVLVQWDKRTWRLGIGTEEEGEEVYARVCRA